MSRKFSVNLMTCLPIVVTMAFTSMAILAEFTPKQDRSRAPASVEPSPLELMKPIMAHTEKLSSQIRTEISADDSSPAAGEAFEVSAKVTLPSRYEEVRVDWKLPPGLRVLSGDSSVSFTEPNIEEPLAVKLRLTSSTNENQQIHLLVSGRVGDVWLNETFQYNTTEQALINEELKALAARNRAYLMKKGSGGH